MRTPFAARIAALLAVAALAALPAAADVVKVADRSASPLPAGAYREGEVIVAFRPATEPFEIERALRTGGAHEVRASRSATRFLVRLEPGDTVPAAVARFSRIPDVDYAEPNGLVRATQGATLVPNDFYYNRLQWNLKQVNAERTWGIQTGKTSVAVAVLDTGVAYEDYFDPGGKPLPNGTLTPPKSFRKAPDWGDTVFLPGYDFVNGDDHPNDDDSHGTHVASTIAEATNNREGVAGLAFGCAIMPVKILDQEGTGTFFDVAEGIDYAIEFTQGGERPVKVINLSLGTESFSQTVKLAVDRAEAAGVLVVAAAGNSGKATVEFPASLPSAIAVGALDARKERASYSNTGADLDLMAPGGNCKRDDDHNGDWDCVWQQMPDFELVAIGRYDEFCYCGLDGTSMATPHVSAAAALLFSQGFTDAKSVRAALEQTAERLGGAPADGRNDTYGHGLIRPAYALPGMGFNLGPKK